MARATGALCSIHSKEAMIPVSRDTIGQLEGRPVDAFRLENGGGLAARVMAYGATLTELHVPDRDGGIADIVLGFGALEGYLATRTYFGATAGRYANRIGGAAFPLEGTTYRLTPNEGSNHLHGGFRGFDKVLWCGEADAARSSVRFHHRSPDGSEGYPGAVDAWVDYRLTEGRLTIELTARTDRPTIVNLVNHSYFNLAGHGSGNVLNQLVTLAADHYTPVDETLIPTGEIAPVQGTPFDFTRPRPIGRDLSLPGLAGGYDHNWVLREGGRGLRPCARAEDPVSGRILELRTTEPGVQFYTGGQLDGLEIGKHGRAYQRFAGFTLETQKFPDSPNNPRFPSAVLEPGADYRHVMEFRFSAS
jgi:aldose 1-epimerase